MAGNEHSGSLSPGIAEISGTAERGGAALKGEAALVRHLFAQAPAGMIAKACAAVALASVLGSTAAMSWLPAWCLVLIAIYAFTFILIHRYRCDGGSSPQRWAQAFQARYLPSGVIWGMTPLFMSSATPAQQLLVVMVIAGICAGSVPILASVFRLYCSYIGVILVPLGLWFVLSPASPHPILGVLTVVFGVVLAYTARNFSMSLQQAFYLAAEKAKLALDLQEANARVDSANRELRYEAAHDALTGLINRREFERCLHRLAASDQSGSPQHALFYIDLDQFKVVNDTCSHSAGD
ncbi:MAG: diguanylate cyclase, partial [Nitrococcus sp.]|nr:diguanylate cyclase [Nitrococcus sp.]